MGKQQWLPEAEIYLGQILRLLQTYECVASIEQHSNKIECFEIFEAAYWAGFCGPKYRIDPKLNRLVRCKIQRPIISRDTIWEYAVQQGWMHSEVDEGEKRYEDIRTVMEWWNEWVYAWDRAPLRRRLKTTHKPAEAGSVRLDSSRLPPAKVGGKWGVG